MVTTATEIAAISSACKRLPETSGKVIANYCNAPAADIDILRPTVTKSLGLRVDERPARWSFGGVDGGHDGLLAVGT